MDYLKVLDDKEKELDIKDNPKELNFFKGIKETSIFTNSVKESFKNNYNDKIYNTENKIFSVKNDKNQKEHKVFNIKNYERIFKKNKEKNLFTFNEEQNAEIIKNIFDKIKIKKIKTQQSINKTIFANRDKNIFTKYSINNTFTNPNPLRTLSNRINKNRTIENNTNLSYENDYNIKNRTSFPKNLILYDKTQDISINQNQTKYPYIESLRKEIIKLDKKAKIFNKNITNKINIGNKEVIKEKKPLNITLLKQNNLTMNNLDYFYEDERKKNFIENRKHINNYIKKLNNFKYNNELVNKFFERKKESIDEFANYMPKVKKKIELEDEYYYLHKKPKIKPIPIINKFNAFIKERFKSQVDKEVFNIFNKKI